MLAHHVVLNWWAERRWQICAYGCLGYRRSSGLAPDIAMLVFSLHRHLEETERIQVNCTRSPWQMEKQVCVLRRAAGQVLGGVHLPSISRHSSFEWHCDKQTFLRGYSPPSSKSSPLLEQSVLLSCDLQLHCFNTGCTQKPLASENRR